MDKAEQRKEKQRIAARKRYARLREDEAWMQAARERNRQYYHAHRDEVTRQQREYYSANREVIREQKREAQKKNRDKRLAYNREYYEKHRNQWKKYAEKKKARKQRETGKETGKETGMKKDYEGYKEAFAAGEHYGAKIYEQKESEIIIALLKTKGYCDKDNCPGETPEDCVSCFASKLCEERLAEGERTKWDG